MRLCEKVALAGLVATVGVVCVNWPQLPNRVPTHFGWSGPPDAYGPKETVWLLPAVTVLLYAILTVASRLSKFSARVPSDNPAVRVRVESIGRDLIGWIKAELTWLFAWITWTTLQIALGHRRGLSPAFGPLLIALPLATAVFFMLKIFAELTSSRRLS